MNEREELMAIMRSGKYDNLVDIADRILAAGFRKALDVSELERWEYGAHGHGDGDTLDRATGAPDDRDLVKLSQVRRLAAPKERWVEVGYIFKFRDSDYIAHVSEGDLASFRNGDSWIEIGPVFMVAPPPTTPAQTAKGKADPCPNCDGLGDLANIGLPHKTCDICDGTGKVANPAQREGS